MLFIEDESRGDYQPVCLFLLLSHWVAFPLFSSTIFLGSSTQTIESSIFSFSASSCPIFPPCFCLKLPILSKHNENKSGEKEPNEMMTSLHQRVSHGLSVSQTSQSITRNILLLNFCQKLTRRRILLRWFWSISSDFRSCYKTRQQKTPLSDLGDHSHHCLHSLLLMTCFVICHLISVT